MLASRLVSQDKSSPFNSIGSGSGNLYREPPLFIYLFFYLSIHHQRGLEDIRVWRWGVNFECTYLELVTVASELESCPLHHAAAAHVDSIISSIHIFLAVGGGMRGPRCRGLINLEWRTTPFAMSMRLGVRHEWTLFFPPMCQNCRIIPNARVFFERGDLGVHACEVAMSPCYRNEGKECESDVC